MGHQVSRSSLYDSASLAKDDPEVRLVTACYQWVLRRRRYLGQRQAGIVRAHWIVRPLLCVVHRDGVQTVPARRRGTFLAGLSSCGLPTLVVALGLLQGVPGHPLFEGGFIGRRHLLKLRLPCPGLSRVHQLPSLRPMHRLSLELAMELAAGILLDPPYAIRRRLLNG